MKKLNSICVCFLFLLNGCGNLKYFRPSPWGNMPSSEIAEMKDYINRNPELKKLAVYPASGKYAANRRYKNDDGPPTVEEISGPYKTLTKCRGKK